MLPLYENGLEREDDWHSLKSVMVKCRHLDVTTARVAFTSLGPRLAATEVGAGIASYFETGDASHLDAAAVKLTGRELPEAWLLIERL